MKFITPRDGNLRLTLQPLNIATRNLVIAQRPATSKPNGKKIGGLFGLFDVNIH